MIRTVLETAAITILCGALYGVGLSVVACLLNAPTLRSARSIIILVFYMALLYAGAGFLPLMFIAYVSYALFDATSLWLTFVMPGLALLALAATILSNVKFFRSICPVRAVRIITIYAGAVAALLIPLAVMALVGSFNGLLLVVFASVFAIMSFLTMLVMRARTSASHSMDASPPIEPKQQAQDRGADGPKFVWFGIDSATWDIMSPMLADGKLPNLNALIRKGCHGNLQSFIPTHSPVIWTSKATGKTPIKHGIRDFLIFNIKGIREPIEVLPVDPVLGMAVSRAARAGLIKRRPVRSHDRTCMAIWNILSDNGYRAGVTSWFVTDPAEKIRGCMVPEFFYILARKWDRPSPRIHPEFLEEPLAKIKAEVKQRFESPDADVEIKERFLADGVIRREEEYKLTVLKVFYFNDVLRKEVTHHLIKSYGMDFIMTYFHGVDAVQHHFWACRNRPDSVFRNVIARYYQYMDEVLGELLDRITGDKTVFVTSDHGHGPCGWGMRILNRMRGRGSLSGDHSSAPDGVFIASGKGIRQGGAIGNISVYDIVPTILPLFGLPVASDMDGRALSEIMTDPQKAVSAIPTYENRPRSAVSDAGDMTEDQEVLRRLRDLGYID